METSITDSTTISTSEITEDSDFAPDPDVFEQVPEKVLNHKVVENHVEYLVKWKGMGSTETSSWIKEDNFSEFQHLVNEYCRNEKIAIPEVKKVTRGMEWDVMEASKENGKVFYRIRYTNGLEAHLSSKELRALGTRNIIEFLEQNFLD
jgi:hypothetical protein